VLTLASIDHLSGEVLVYTFGAREHCVLESCFCCLYPCISKVYADGNYVYEKILGADKVKVGKWNTQKIERKHLSLRTWVKRLARKTICFLKSL
jgi:insertion element IS1 protein InsB